MVGVAVRHLPVVGGPESRFYLTPFGASRPGVAVRSLKTLFAEGKFYTPLKTTRPAGPTPKREKKNDPLKNVIRA